MKDITAIGEMLIDLTQTGVENAIPRFAANPGGAPANLAVAASRLGSDTAFIGKVGSDAFGVYLEKVLRENNVDVSSLLHDPSAPTTLAVVSVDSSGERSFAFYRENSADVLLREDEVSDNALENTVILHFGSVSLTTDPERSATLSAVRRARAMGKTISYDPNYRPSLWKSRKEAEEVMKAALPLCDILKVSDEELEILTGTSDLAKGSALLSSYGISLVFVTLGADGVFFRRGDETGKVDGIKVDVGDTNGAGDTFFGAALSRLVKEDWRNVPFGTIRSIAEYVNRAASITASRCGAIPAMPFRAELEN